MTDPYFASLCAAYIMFYKSGICTEYFRPQDEVHPVVTSIFRFYPYWHMRRFLRQPKLMNAYLDATDLKLVRSHIPTKEVWSKKTKYTKETFSSFYAEKKKEGKKVKNAKYYGAGGGGGVLGIKYDEVTKIINQGDDDWKKFLPTTSKGINRCGQLLLQQAVEAFVYCVLGAQVKTRWAIMGTGAKSSKTQVIFHQLVEETIAPSNDAVMITNMRAAISGSNVLLDMAIISGVILVPSKLIILDKPIPGYNNVLTIAKQTMKFGVNQGINQQAVVPQLTSNALPPKPTGVAKLGTGVTNPAKPTGSKNSKVVAPVKKNLPKLSIKTPCARAMHQDRVVLGMIGVAIVGGLVFALK